MQVATVKDTGAYAGDLLIGAQDANAGLLIRIHTAQKGGRGGRIIGAFELLDGGDGPYAGHLKKLENKRFDSAADLIEKLAPFIRISNMHILNCNMLAVYTGEDE